MFRDSLEFEQANRLLGKMAGRVLAKLKLQYEDTKDKPHYYPTSCSLFIPFSFHDKMEVSAVEFRLGKWDKKKSMETYKLLKGEQFLEMKLAVPQTAEEFIALEEKIVDVAKAFLK